MQTKVVLLRNAWVVTGFPQRALAIGLLLTGAVASVWDDAFVSAAEAAVLETPAVSVPRHIAALQALPPLPTDVESVRRLPVGLFDSGTGGLTVVEQLLALDEFRNGSDNPGPDGQPDFAKEQFVFLADLANMPYGYYPTIGKRDFLLDLAGEDVLFLLGTSYHRSPEDTASTGRKRCVKSLVIACNTATAHAEEYLERTLSQTDVEVEITGVIQAGAEAALDVIARHQAGTVGVLATQGTVLSGGYPRALRQVAEQRGFQGPLRIVQQGSLGLAGAIDGAAEFVTRNVSAAGPRADYRGPSLDKAGATIDKRLLSCYGFDFSSGKMLCQGNPVDPEVLQVNAVENYVAYDVTMLLESVRAAKLDQPLRVVVLGCTHFPLVADQIRKQFQRLYDHREDGRYVYRSCMAEDVVLIDPAVQVARDVLHCLARQGRLAVEALPAGMPRGEFYVSVPDRQHPAVRLDAQGGFTHEYKYGRGPRYDGCDVLRVPLVPASLDPESRQRLKSQIPRTWALLEEFGQSIDRASGR